MGPSSWSSSPILWCCSTGWRSGRDPCTTYSLLRPTLTRVRYPSRSRSATMLDAARSVMPTRNAMSRIRISDSCAIQTSTCAWFERNVQERWSCWSCRTSLSSPTLCSDRPQAERTSKTGKVVHVFDIRFTSVSRYRRIPLKRVDTRKHPPARVGAYFSAAWRAGCRRRPGTLCQACSTPASAASAAVIAGRFFPATAKKSLSVFSTFGWALRVRARPVVVRTTRWARLSSVLVLRAT